MNRKILLILCLFLLSQMLNAQYPGIVHSISRGEGLSNGAVNAITQDAEGYVWFGTWNGLNRYDGTNIATFLPGTKPHTIHNHVVRGLYPTATGPLWMLTNEGLSLYDNLTNRFYPFFTDESEQFNYENDISFTHSDKYGTTAGLFGKGIFTYNSLSKQFELFKFNAGSSKASLEIKRIQMIGRDLYCITANNKLYKISGNNLEEIIQLPINLELSSLVGFMVTNDPYLLVTQRGGDALMINVSRKTYKFLEIPNDIITSFAQSSTEDRLWAGTEKGKIYSLNTTTIEFDILNIPSDLFVKNPIATRVLSIYETAPDILWIGTDGNGVYNMKLSDFPNTILSSRLLSYPIVRSILVTSNNDMLIGTKGGGIDIFDSSGKHLKVISVKDGLSNNSVLSFHERTDGSIWVGTDGVGIDVISPDYNTIKNYPRDFSISTKQGFASVYRIMEDSDNRLYLGTSGYGVIMIDFDDNNPSVPVYHEQVILDKTSGGQQKQIVYAITEERPGIIWIGTRGIGVYRYNTITKRVLSQYNSNTDPSIIKNDDILALFVDDKKNIWVGSSAGIFSLTPSVSGKIKAARLQLHDELSNTPIHAIQMDTTQRNLWVSTNKGLSCIDVINKTVKSFTSNDGLINIEYSDGASFYDSASGTLYVGGTMGVDMIKTEEIEFASFFPPLAVNDLYIKNHIVEVAEESLLDNRINLQPKLVLSSSENALTFYVSPLVFWGKERHKVSYRLMNFDENWVLNPINQSINFTNLSPGAYKLQLRVSDENGNWSSKVKEIEIIINPPLWRTNWAIALYILLILGVQLLFIRSYLIRQARRKEAVLLELTQLKEKELQNYKIEFFTNIAHEFRTPLTLITSHIHGMLEENEQTSKNPRMLKVYNNTIKLQKLVLEIIQFRKLEKGKEPLYISSVSPEALVREVITDLEPLALKREITCEVKCNLEHANFNTDADKYQRIITNLVSNAIKYNNPGGYIIVRISFNKNELITEVEDNGMGINPDFKSKVFEPFGISSSQKRGSFPGYKSTGLGLAVTKGIVELLKGTISFESIPNKGTIFTCRFPDIHQVNTTNLIESSNDSSDEMAFIDEINYADIEVREDPLAASKPTLLIADDDDEILQLLKDMLRNSYNLFLAKNGNEAIIILENQEIDLVISDIMMPEMDGIELCWKLRENFDTSHLPLILLTAKSEIEDRIKGLEAGADSYIPKPFHPGHLKIRIEKLLTNRKNIRKNFAKQDDTTILINEISDPFFIKLLEYIDQNIDDESLLTEKLCDKFAISKSSLYKKTKSVLGATPHGLINQRRVRKASILLDSTSLTVSEIIDQTGFNSRAHFYDVFNKAYGCSPTEHRHKTKVPK